MDELDLDIALDIMQLKIKEYLKNKTGLSKQEFIEGLKQLVEEKDKLYDLDDETIDKVYNLYLEEIKKEEK